MTPGYLEASIIVNERASTARSTRLLVIVQAATIIAINAMILLDMLASGPTPLFGREWANTGHAWIACCELLILAYTITQYRRLKSHPDQ